MKNWKLLSLTFLTALLISTGCQPKLAESPYGPREKKWEDFIKATYPDWEPPQTEPPARIVPASVDKNVAPMVIKDDDVIIEEPADAPVIDTPAAEANIETAETAEFQTYTVQKGDTLWSIARHFYGSGKKWRDIFEANKDVLSAPDKVRAGLEIKIPSAN